MTKIPITKPFFGDEEMAAVQEPLKSGWVVQGPYVQRFEEKFAEFAGADRAVATSSCTTALHLAVVAMDLGPGDEVLVPAFTWVATANVVEYMDGTPVFVDVDPRTFNVDPHALADAVTGDTVGMIPVHLFGLCADMGPIMDLAEEEDLWVIEDAACGLGAWQDSRHAGTFGEMGCFSFHPRKSVTTGEGGIMTTDDPERADLLRSLRDHGATRSDLDRHHNEGGFLLPGYPHVGYNYRMTDLQGAVGSVQMDRAEHILERRRALAARYDEVIEELGWLSSPYTPDGFTHGYQAYVCRFHPEEPTIENVEDLNQHRNELMHRLERRGIATRPGTHAAALQGYYRSKYGITPEDFPQAYIAEQLTLALPLYVQMTNEEQELVLQELQAVYRETA